MKFKIDKFYFALSLVTLTGGVLRLININYASLWADELYSMLSVHPDNSWYGVLYLQKAFQPPGYYIVLWIWTKIFLFNDFYARLLSVIMGCVAIFLSGLLGKIIKNDRLGIIISLIVAFNPVQIWNSLEVRFYIFTYVFTVLSLIFYLFIIRKRYSSHWVLVTKSIIDAALIYFHHFGILLIISQFLNDIFLFYRNKEKKIFFTKIFGYVISALLYLPWVIWGLTEGLAIKSYWFKDISIYNYLTYNFGYYHWFHFVLFAMIIFTAIKNYRDNIVMLLLLICFCTLTFPLFYSYYRIPILVPRYSMVMAPALYLLVGFAVYDLAMRLSKWNRKLYIFFLVNCLFIFTYRGINITFFDKSYLSKQPWREMVNWLKSQADYNETPVFSRGAYVYKKFTVDYYFGNSKKAEHIDDLKGSKYNKMYLVSVGNDGPWKITDSSKYKIKKYYNMESIQFKEGNSVSSEIIICKKKDSGL